MAQSSYKAFWHHNLCASTRINQYPKEIQIQTPCGYGFVFSNLFLLCIATLCPPWHPRHSSNSEHCLLPMAPCLPMQPPLKQSPRHPVDLRNKTTQPDSSKMVTSDSRPSRCFAGDVQGSWWHICWAQAPRATSSASWLSPLSWVNKGLSP